MTFQRPSRPPLHPTPARRLFFAWSLIWGTMMTAPLAVCMLVHSLLSRSPRAFRLWLRLWGKAILFGFGVQLRTRILQPIPEEQPVVFVANHQNMLDILTCAAGIPHSYGFAAKASLRRMPFIGAVLRASSSVFVDRSTPRRAAESIREAADVIRNGTSVLIYIEGERTYGPTLEAFLRGAFLLAVEAGVPLVPVIQLDNYEVMNERLKVARPGVVHMVVAEPIPTTGCSRGDISVLMERVRTVMQRELDRNAPSSTAGSIEEADVSSHASQAPHR